MKFSTLLLTKDYILERVNEEEVFEYFLGEEVILYTKYYRNPLRNDTNPGCKFILGNLDGRVLFWDTSYNIFYNIFDFVKSIYGVSFYESLKIINELFIEQKEENFIKIDKRQFIKNKKEENPFKIKQREYNEKELSFWNVGGLEIDQKILNEHEIYCVETYWENEYVVDNCKMTFAYYDMGIPLQLYFPNNKKKGRRRFSLSQKRYWGGIKWVDFNKDYIFIIPKRKCSFYATQFGINNIYTLIERYTNDKLMDFLKQKFSTIIYLADNDRHGKSAAWMYRKLFNVEIAFIPEGKDFTECLELIGKNGIIDLINEYKSHY